MLASSHVAEVHKYIFDCCYEFVAMPESPDECASQFIVEDDSQAYDECGLGGATPLISYSMSPPAKAGTFPVADYIGTELAPYSYADPPARQEHGLVPQLLERTARSCHRISSQDYAKLVARMYNCKMAELLPSPADFILGLFGRWK